MYRADALATLARKKCWTFVYKNSLGYYTIVKGKDYRMATTLKEMAEIIEAL